MDIWNQMEVVVAVWYELRRIDRFLCLRSRVVVWNGSARYSSRLSPLLVTGVRHFDALFRVFMHFSLRPVCLLWLLILQAGLLLSFALPCSAQSLSVLLQRALDSDPTYLGARTGVDVADAKRRQARGALLPQVSISASTNDNDRRYKTRNSSYPPERDNYNNNTSQVTLTQPLWRYANIVGWQQAKAIAAQAEHQLSGAEQDLFGRLVTAWFDVLAARDNVLFTIQQAAAARRFWETARRGSDLGTHSEPQTEEAKAKLDQAISDALTAETEAHLKLAALEQIVGNLKNLNPPFMREGIVLEDLSPAKLEDWLAKVEVQNPATLAAMQAYEAASDEVRKQRAGHQPTLDLVASYGKNSQAVGGFPGQSGYDIKTGTIGLQLNVPLFTGGTQWAKVDEALAQKEKARLDIEAARRSAMLATKQAWFGWQAARGRSHAGQQAVKSAAAALEVARKGGDSGLKTELDNLQAEQQLQAAKRDYRKARYDQMVAYVKLKATAGLLTQADIQALDALFVATEETVPPRQAEGKQLVRWAEQR